METKPLNRLPKIIRNVALTVFLAIFCSLFLGLIVLGILGSFPSNEWWSGFYHTDLWSWLQLIAVPFTVIFVGIVIIAVLYMMNIEGRNRQAQAAEADVSKIADYVAAANPANIQEVAASQLVISSRYYESVLHQSERSFRWALIWASIGTSVIVLAVLFFIIKEPSNISAYGSLIGGIVIEAIAGLNFYLYARATSQLANFQAPLDRVGRFLIANSICESLEGEVKAHTRAKLVETIADVSNTEYQKDSPNVKASNKRSNQAKREAEHALKNEGDNKLLADD